MSVNLKDNRLRIGRIRITPLFIKRSRPVSKKLPKKYWDAGMRRINVPFFNIDIFPKK